VLYGIPNYGNLATNPTPLQFGLLQEVQLEFKGDLKRLYGTQQFALSIARGKVTEGKGTREFLEEYRLSICDVVYSAAQARNLKRAPIQRITVAPKLTADAILERPNSNVMIQTTEKVVAVGASTGGTEA